MRKVYPDMEEAAVSACILMQQLEEKWEQNGRKGKCPLNNSLYYAVTDMRASGTKPPEVTQEQYEILKISVSAYENYIKEHGSRNEN